MANTVIKEKQQKLISLMKEINLSKEDIIDYLNSIGIKKVTINTKLKADVVAKVHAHFRKNIEEQDKHLKKVLDFATRNKIEMYEVDEHIKQVEEERLQNEEEERIKKAIDEESKRKEEEKRKQELKAFLERNKMLKEKDEKEKKEREAKKKKKVATKKIEDKKKHLPVTKEKLATKETDIIKKKKTEEKVTEKKPVVKKREEKEKKKTPDKKVEEKGFKKGKFEKVTIRDLRKKKAGTTDYKRRETISKRKGVAPKTEKGSDADKKKYYDKKDKGDKINQTFDRKRKGKNTKEYKTREIKQKDIDNAIRETFTKIGGAGSATARSLTRKRKKKVRLEQEQKTQELAELEKNVINVTEFISTSELANLMNIDTNEIIKKCFDLGMMVSINQRLEKDLIVLMAEEFGYTIEFQTEYEEDVLIEEEDPEESLKERPPVVTIMGHVDHGKTSLLDNIRKSNVVAGEAGGITQHIGAYKVVTSSGKAITFLDTPGHEAFTAMRARGGQAADIVVLVVAADDSVMPQTVEAINHALAAGVPIIIAINKVDKPEANPDKIKQQLADKDILIEEWGGKYQSVEISAKFGKNLEGLLEKILLEAEILDLKSNPDREARGVILEAKLDKGKGITSTVLVQKGTLKIGDSFIAGIYPGKVKAMFDEREHKIYKAVPSTAVQILGFDGMPQAGDTFVVLKSERDTKSISIKRQQLKREQDLRQVKFTTLDDISKQILEGKQVELNIILKADTDGSAEAIADSLQKLDAPEAKVRVIHKALGQISESDVLLAEASRAIIIGFNVRPNFSARKLAEKHLVDIRLYSIIYNVIDEIKLALEGLLEPEISEKITATIEVREIFKVPKVGNIAGCYVRDGKISRNDKIRLLREGLVIYDGNILSLKRIKDDVKEVESGYECGIGLENFNDIKIDDVIEGYELVETKRKLTLT
jgi:translation initiation factor IF-2